MEKRGETSTTGKKREVTKMKRKKTLSKLFSTVMAAALTVGGLVFSQPVTAQAESPYTAFLMFTDYDWAYGNWDSTLESATTSVAEDGTYTVTLNAAEVGGDGQTGANGAQTFCVDIVGMQADLLEEGKTLEVTDLAVLADGKEVTVDTSKLVTGDIEENGNYRIEIFNIYGETANNAPIDSEALTFTDTLSVEFSIKTVDYVADETASTEVAATEETSAGIDLDGTYNAYLGLQTPNWSYRDSWNADNGIGSEYWGQFIYGNETSETYGTVTDAVIAGNGTYTVSVTDFGTIFSDDFTAAGQDYFNLLFISTDIPLSDSISVTDVTLKMDGKTITTYATAVLDPDETEYVKILVQNIWNEDIAELPFYAAPAESVEMTFTISGFNYDNEAAAAVESTEAAEVTAEAAEVETENSGVNPVVVVVIVVLAVAAGAAVIVLQKKKKENK